MVLYRRRRRRSLGWAKRRGKLASMVNVRAYIPCMQTSKHQYTHQGSKQGYDASSCRIYTIDIVIISSTRQLWYNRTAHKPSNSLDDWPAIAGRLPMAYRCLQK